MWCWGYNDRFQLGLDRSTAFAPPTDYPDPKPVPDLPLPAIEVGLGADHSCALLEDRSVWCWGDNQSGELGRGTVSTGGELPAVVPGLRDIERLAIGGRHSCVLHGTGRISCWGDNDSMQTGSPDAAQDVVSPTEIAGLVVADVVAGAAHTCALFDGHVSCWGDNGSGQLGDGTQTSRATGGRLSMAADYVALAAGAAISCAVHDDGRISCWGGNQNAYTGDGTFEQRFTETQVRGLGSAVAVSAGGNATCARTGTEGVWCWGSGSLGELGDGVTAQPTPNAVGIDASDIAVGDRHSCALTTDGVACWGRNDRGQLGDGTTVDRAVPGKVSPVWTGTPTRVVAGTQHVCVLVGGEVWCWGDNEYLQLGESTVASSPLPIRVSLPAPATAVRAGRQFTCALLNDGGVACWGRNDSGQLGDGTTTDRATPARVATSTADLGGITELVLGGEFGCATSGGSTLCWGNNEVGQLATGTLGGNAVFATAAMVNPGTVVAAGGKSACARTPGLVCWGYNGWGNLGGGSTSYEPLPVDSTFSATPNLADAQTCYGSSGPACLGANGYGETGTGTMSYSATGPLLIPDGASQIALGAQHSCARSGTTAVFCWGDNLYGELGLGTASRSAVPVHSRLP